jgi:hypothetical protein
MTGLFLAKLTTIIVVYNVGEKIIEEIIGGDNNRIEIDELKSHLNVVIYFSIGITVIMFLQIIFVFCYVGSLRNRNNEFDYKFVDEDGNKLTIR